MIEQRHKRAFEAVRDLVGETPDLAAFAQWPDAVVYEGSTIKTVPAADILHAWNVGRGDAAGRLHEAIRGLAHHVAWRQSYTEAEVGADFLARYGWFELIGPGGFYRSGNYRAYIGFWDHGLHYPWHLHEAEELYYVISGEAEFEAEGETPATLGPGDTRHHAGYQPHAMTTRDAPVLTLVLWRGPGLTGSPRMGRT